ncbi:MAG TPA: hypothetical protein VGM23_01515 [Armatimonadota bacterium]|jgi:hypothetical protein
MRCQSQIGFLMLHRCENLAQHKCTLCGRNVCPQHAVFPGMDQPVAATAQPTAAPIPGVPPTMSAPPPPGGTEVEGVICQECARKQQQTVQQGPYQQQRGFYRDDYYGYPYYGGYHPYYWGYDYNDHDRHVFDRQHNQAGVSDAQES